MAAGLQIEAGGIIEQMEADLLVRTCIQEGCEQKRSLCGERERTREEEKERELKTKTRGVLETEMMSEHKP